MQKKQRRATGCDGMQGDLKEEFKGGNERKEEIQSQF